VFATAEGGQLVLLAARRVTVPDEWWQLTTTRRHGDRAVTHTDVGVRVLWELHKGEHVAKAAVRRVGLAGQELVYLVNGAIRETCHFREDQADALRRVARQKHIELKARGWTTA
jgi:hypothetical protein